MTIDTLIAKIVQHIINPTIILIFAGGLVYFLIGVLKYIKNADNSTARTEGVSHIIWGLAGMFVMISAFTLIKIVLGTFNITPPPGLR